MRENLPVTQQEFVYPEGQALVSTTDLKGRITYCNDAFVRVSGFERGELIGQPHNLIRHPDMPADAFADLWRCIQRGTPWSAMVKNRRKNGDHYWVQANVTPLLDGGQVVGYMSVRTRPSRADVASAEAVYAGLRQERGRGQRRHAVLEGRACRVDLRGRVQGRLRAVAGDRLGLTAVAVALAACALGLAAPAGAAGSAAALGGALLLGGVGAALQHRGVQAPLRRLLEAARRLAAGDLTQGAPAGSDGLTRELGVALNQLSVNLMSIVSDAQRDVRRIQGAAGEIKAGNGELSSRTEAQASSLQQTAASMEQITAAVRSAAESAGEASRLAHSAQDVTQQTCEAVAGVGETMRDISASSSRITDICGVVDSITFQTNLLALNAAIEAARAGPHGRSFAVVAAEVRALAERTAGAAREIRSLVDASLQQVQAGEQRAERAQDAMRQTLTAVQRVGSLVGEISGGAQEQLQGISQINAAVAEIDGITQRNAAMVEELAASAVSLEEQAQSVAGSIGVFKTAVLREAVPA